MSNTENDGDRPQRNPSNIDRAIRVSAGPIMFGAAVLHPQLFTDGEFKDSAIGTALWMVLLIALVIYYV